MIYKQWPSKHGQVSIANMATDHIINSLALLVKDVMFRKYKIKPIFDEMNAKELNGFMRSFKRELKYREARL